MLALGAAGVLQVDRELENQLGRLGTIFQGLESSGDVPEARLLAAACSRERIEALCRELGSPAIEIAMDNCPHQVVLAGEPREVDRVAERLRQESILWEALPFSRAYHTSSFAAVLAPFAEFFAQLTFRPPRIPIYSCALRQAMPGDPEAIRALAVAQWTRTVAFRETIEAMHSDGLRLFVDVGSRGNLAGFAEDILRCKPAFAIAANLPRRGGPTQLNHLVAAIFAHGASLRADYLYARRRPRPIDWKIADGPPRATVELKIGFPEMKVSEELISRLRSRPHAAAVAPPHESPIHHAAISRDRAYRSAPGDGIANGFTHHEESPAPSVSTLSYPEERFTMIEPNGTGKIDAESGGQPVQADIRLSSTSSVEPESPTDGTPYSSFPPGEPEPEVFDFNSRENREEYDAPLEAASVEAAMVSFQETMRAFLQTQQEVLNAYLIPPAWETGETLGSCGSVADYSSSCQVIGESVEDRTYDPEGEGNCSRPDENAPGSGSLVEWVDGSQSTAFDRAGTDEPIRSGPSPGPWAGEVRRLVPGAEIETFFLLDRRDDPIAEHHTLGGRKISALDKSLLGLPVMPFAVMAEMTAQVAALVVSPGLVLTTLVQVRAHKWVRYEEAPSQLEIRGQRVRGSGNGDERVWVGIFNRGPAGENEATRPVFEATAVFGPSVLAPPLAAPWSPARPQVSRFTAESLYNDQWLFHGPPFQALVEVGKFSEEGIDGTLRVLPFEPLVRPGQRAAMHTDLIVIDSFTHLLGCWGLDSLKEGDIVYPLRLEALELYGNRPPVGTDVACRITIEEVERHRLRVLVEIVRPDGTVWIRIRDWEDWRFHWPARYRDVFRQPEVILLGEEIPLFDPRHGPVSQAKCVWLEPPADMGRPVWRDVLEYTQLGPAERTAFLASCGPDRRRAHRLWGRIAAKEAARRLWQDEGLPPTYPADLAILANREGQPQLVRVQDREDRALPAISIAHADGVAVALAARDPSALVGIDVEPITSRPSGFEESAFTPAERSLLDRWTGANRAEWVARFWCAKEAAAKAAGVGLAAGPSSAEVVGIDEGSAEMLVRLSPELLAACSKRIESHLRAVSARRGNYAWAWTLEAGARSS